MQATKDIKTLSFKEEANIIRIYEFMRENKKATTLIDLYIEFIDLDKTEMRSSLKVLIDDGYIVDQVINGDEAYQVIDSKKKFNNRDVKTMIRHIHKHIESKKMSHVIKKIKSVARESDREFDKYSNLGKFYTLIGYIEKNYNKHLSIKDYKKIFKNNKFMSQKEYTKLVLDDLYYEKDDGLIYYRDEAPQHFYKPLVIRNNYFEFDKIIPRKIELFYPDEDKLEYVDNKDAIQEFLKPYKYLLK